MPTSRVRAYMSIITLLLCLQTFGCMTNQTRQEPFNQVVILIDASGSYHSRQAEALKSATDRLQELAELELKRWEEDLDQITVISLDAVPEVIWHGNLKDLKDSLEPTQAGGTDPKAAWADRFKTRTDYASCTDVGAAFRLAASHLNGDARYVDKYLIAFTDGIDEPPLASIKNCRPAKHPSLPPDDFPWETLRGVSVSVFWVPPEQKLAWQRTVASHNLSESFSLYTTSESAQVKIKTITRAEREPDATESAANRQQVLGLAKTAAVIAFVFAGALVGLLFWARHRAPRPAAARPKPAAAGRANNPAISGPRPLASRPAPQRNRRP